MFLLDAEKSSQSLTASRHGATGTELDAESRLAGAPLTAAITPWTPGWRRGLSDCLHPASATAPCRNIPNCIHGQLKVHFYHFGWSIYVKDINYFDINFFLNV